MSSPILRTHSFVDRPKQDEALVRECLLGDEKAWSALIQKYANLIFSIPVKRGFTPDDAADVFQSVCVAWIRSLPALRNARALPAWLIRTTAHTCDRMQAERRRGTSLDSEKSEPVHGENLPDEFVSQLEREQLLRESISELAPDCRELIGLLFFTDPPIPYEAAAAKLGLAKGSIGATRMRCLDRLRRSLEEKGFG